MKDSITGTVRSNTIVETAASKAPQDVCAIKKTGVFNHQFTDTSPYARRNAEECVE